MTQPATTKSMMDRISYESILFDTNKWKFSFTGILTPAKFDCCIVNQDTSKIKDRLTATVSLGVNETKVLGFEDFNGDLEQALNGDSFFFAIITLSNDPANTKDSDPVVYSFDITPEQLAEIKSTLPAPAKTSQKPATSATPPAAKTSPKPAKTAATPPANSPVEAPVKKSAKAKTAKPAATEKQVTEMLALTAQIATLNEKLTVSAEDEAIVASISEELPRVRKALETLGESWQQVSSNLGTMATANDMRNLFDQQTKALDALGNRLNDATTALGNQTRSTPQYTARQAFMGWILLLLILGLLVLGGLYLFRHHDIPTAVGSGPATITVSGNNNLDRGSFIGQKIYNITEEAPAMTITNIWLPAPAPTQPETHTEPSVINDSANSSDDDHYIGEVDQPQQQVVATVNSRPVFVDTSYYQVYSIPGNTWGNNCRRGNNWGYQSQQRYCTSPGIPNRIFVPYH